jgi:hypothetical protein
MACSLRKNMCKTTKAILARLCDIRCCVDNDWCWGCVNQDISFDEYETALFINDAEDVRKIIDVKTNKVVGIMFKDSNRNFDRMEKVAAECERCQVATLSDSNH